jgi:hypothetical protein
VRALTVAGAGLADNEDSSPLHHFGRIGDLFLVGHPQKAIQIIGVVETGVAEAKC